MQRHLPIKNDQAQMNRFVKRVETITQQNMSAKKQNKAFLEVVRDFREKLSDKTIRCKICNFVSKRADHLKTHLARHVVPPLKLYPCSNCPAQFMRYRRNQLHFYSCSKLWIHCRQDEKNRHEQKYCPNRRKR